MKQEETKQKQEETKQPKKLKKVWKILLIILLAFLCAVVLFTLGLFVFHRVKTAQEIKKLKAAGYYNPVSVGDYSLNVAVFGNEHGKHTVVGIAGLGSADYSVAARQMTACFEDDNRVVFVDRAGYGFSGDTNRDMTLETIVEDYRKALKNAGIEGPYVLMPHSIGGAYANYWACHYPDEIEGIVFIDGSELSADAFSDEEVNGKVSLGDKALATLAKLGFSRLVLRNYYYHLPDNYSEEEQSLGDALTIMEMDSIAAVSESELLAKNAQDAFNGLTKTAIPKRYICASWGAHTKEEVVENNKWINRQLELNHLKMKPRPTDPNDESVQKVLDQSEQLRNDVLLPYIEKMGNCELKYLAGDHMIYEQKPEECGALVKEFLDSLEG